MAKKIYIISILLLLCSLSGAQTPTWISDITNLTAEDYSNLKLPPLADLLEGSRNYSGVQYYENLKLEELSELKTIKREWLNYLKVNANYQYGVVNDLSSYMDINSTYVSQYNGKLQNIYSAGATISVPFIAIFDRKNKITRQKYKIQATAAEASRTQDEVNLKIIDAYTQAVENLALLKASSESVTLADAQYRLSEAEFIKGKLDAQSLSRQKNIQTQTIRDYELTRAAVNNAILRLEILSKVKILK